MLGILHKRKKKLRGKPAEATVANAEVAEVDTGTPSESRKALHSGAAPVFTPAATPVDATSLKRKAPTGAPARRSRSTRKRAVLNSLGEEPSMKENSVSDPNNVKTPAKERLEICTPVKSAEALQTRDYDALPIPQERETPANNMDKLVAKTPAKPKHAALPGVLDKPVEFPNAQSLETPAKTTQVKEMETPVNTAETAETSSLTELKHQDSTPAKNSELDLIHDPRSAAMKETPPQLISGAARIVNVPAAPKKDRLRAKYAHLLDPSVRARYQQKLSGGVEQLPSFMKALEKAFSALETAVNFLVGRKDPAVFHKVKKSVETLCNKYVVRFLFNLHRSFDLPQLAKIMSVYPDAYKLKPLRAKINGATVETLLLEPIPLVSRVSAPSSFPDTEIQAVESQDPKEKRSVHAEAHRVASNSAARKNHFHDRLLDLVFQAHQDFLSSRGHDIADRKTRFDLLNYHSEFDVELHVPDITGTELPSLGAKPVSTSAIDKDASKSMRNERASSKTDVSTPYHQQSSESLPSTPKLSRYEALKLRVRHYSLLTGIRLPRGRRSVKKNPYSNLQRPLHRFAWMRLRVAFQTWCNALPCMLVV